MIVTRPRLRELKMTKPKDQHVKRTLLALDSSTKAMLEELSARISIVTGNKPNNSLTVRLLIEKNYSEMLLRDAAKNEKN